MVNSTKYELSPSTVDTTTTARLANQTHTPTVASTTSLSRDHKPAAAAAAAAVAGGDVISTTLHFNGVIKSAVTTTVAVQADSTSTSTAASANDMSSSAIGVAVGVAVGVVVLLILIAAVITFCIRRRVVRRSNRSIMKIENPQYKLADCEDKDGTLSTAPTVAFSANNNRASVSGLSKSRKRNEAPAPPIYRPPTETGSGRTWDSLTKRKAPPPPLNINTSDLYGKDSPSVSVENVSSAVNKNSASPVDDNNDLQTDRSHMKPLIAAGTSTDMDKKQLSPKRDSKLVASPKKLSPSVVNKKRKEEEEEVEGQGEAEADTKMALIGKKAASNLSLDSYDRTKNPFFAD